MKNKMEQFFEDFLKNGYAILDVENPLFLDKIRIKLKKQLKCNDLENLHKSINYSEINNERIKSYRALNNIDNWESEYFSLASEKLVNLLGPDISIQSKLNLSIQMPNDSSSILALHTDALSGQSVFEVVLWVPLTKVFDSNAMYIFSREKTYEILE